MIVVDAKTPATAVLEAVNCPDDVRRNRLCLEHVLSVVGAYNALEIAPLGLAEPKLRLPLAPGGEA